MQNFRMQNRKICCENMNESARRRMILLFAIFCAFICIALVICVIQYNRNSSTYQPSSEETFDYLLLSLSWPISFCRWCTENGEINATDACYLAKNENNWLIHGLWPNKMGIPPWPEYCSPSSFNETELEPIRAELEEYWSTVSKNWTNSLFWKHEWLKHGTCALQSEPLNTQLKYFQTSLELYKQYNITRALKECGVYSHDSKLYNNNEFIDCFKKHFNVHPQLSCKTIRNKETLEEIRLCFDKNLTIQDCDIYVQKYCLGNFIYPTIVEPKV